MFASRPRFATIGFVVSALPDEFAGIVGERVTIHRTDHIHSHGRPRRRHYPRAPHAGLVTSGPAARRLLAAGADLVLPLTCAGCDAPGTDWCDNCAHGLIDVPRKLRPRVAIGAQAWAVGAYRGALRRAIIATKEHGRRDLSGPLGHAVGEAIITLARWGELPDAPRIDLIPAPTRTLAARRRGGDPVTAIAAAAAVRLGRRAHLSPMLVTSMITRDSAGLDARQRRANLRGRVRMTRAAATSTAATQRRLYLLVDDVLTTGATAAESVRVLAAHGIEIAAVVVLTGA